MKRKLVELLVCSLILVCLTGCKEEKQTSNKEDKTQTVTEATVEKEEKHEDTQQKEMLQSEQEAQSQTQTETLKETDVVENKPEQEEEKQENKVVESEKKPTEATQTQNPTTTSKPTVTNPTPETPKVEETPTVPKEPNATANDCKAVADKVIEYINSYRSTPATKLPGLTVYAEYRSRQLISNFAHDTFDERAAATALQYGTYIEPTLYGIEGEPYYAAGAREAIAKAGYVGTIDYVAKSIADLVKNSAGHWAYVGSSEYPYIAVGVTYESDMWYCDIAMARENTDNK